MEKATIGNYIIKVALSQNISQDTSSGTKDFTVSVSQSENGPWTEIKWGTFTDPRSTGEVFSPQELKTFQIDQVTARYVKFTCVTYYGLGCVLQYIGVFGNKGKVILH